MLRPLSVQLSRAWANHLPIIGAKLIDRVKPKYLYTLFAHRPREGKTPKENYLAASLAYVLERSPQAAAAVAASFLGKSVSELCEPFEVRAQVPFRSAGRKSTVVYPDIIIRERYATGTSFLILVENKWDSVADLEQLATYRHLELGARLIFISPSTGQNALALE